MPRILFDHSTPRGLRTFLTGGTRTAKEQGWATLANGDLLAAAEAAGFGVFVTADRNLRYQQNLTRRSLAIVVLRSNLWRLVRGNGEHIARVIAAAAPGTYVEVDLPPRRPTPSA